MTYLSSRFSNRGEAVMTASANEGFYENNKAFEKFNMSLEAAFTAFMGATHGLSAVTATALLLSAASLTF